MRGDTLDAKREADERCDRSAPLPPGGFVNQADGTAWMAMYCLNLMRIALELAQRNHVYEDIARGDRHRVVRRGTGSPRHA